MNGAMPVIPYISMATVAFIYKLHGPLLHVGRKYANVVTKPTFYYIHLRLLTQISVPLSLNIRYRLTHELGTASCAVYKAVVLMTAIYQDIRRPESPPHLTFNLALLCCVPRECPLAISA